MNQDAQFYNLFLEKDAVDFSQKLAELFPDLTDEQLSFLEEARQKCFAAGFEVGKLYEKINK